MISELVNVQCVLSRTMLVADWAGKSWSNQMFGFHMDSHRGGSIGAELTLSTAPSPVIQAVQHFLDGLSHLFKQKNKRWLYLSKNGIWKITDTFPVFISRLVSLKRIFRLEHLVTMFTAIVWDDTTKMMNLNVIFNIGWKLWAIITLTASTLPVFILPHFGLNKLIKLWRKQCYKLFFIG